MTDVRYVLFTGHTLIVKQSGFESRQQIKDVSLRDHHVSSVKAAVPRILNRKREKGKPFLLETCIFPLCPFFRLSYRPDLLLRSSSCLQPSYAYSPVEGPIPRADHPVHDFPSAYKSVINTIKGNISFLGDNQVKDLIKLWFSRS